MSTVTRAIGVAALILLFVAILFPWKSVARRVAFEISRASGSQIELGELSPGFSARGPVLAASDVLIDHPALDRLRIHRLEMAPRISSSWLSGEPTLRVWADSEIGLVDGILRLGSASAFQGRVERVDIANLPLRLDASGLSLSGQLTADADIALDPSGQLQGSVEFESDSLIVQTSLLPLAIPFTKATGTVEVLETGATRIQEARFDGPLIQGDLSGEIGMVHRSLSPPIDLDARIQIVDETLLEMAPGAGLDVAESGDVSIHLGGTVDAPEMSTLQSAAARSRAARRRP